MWHVTQVAIWVTRGTCGKSYIWMRHVTQLSRIDMRYSSRPVGWLRLTGSLKLQVCFAGYSLFYRALLQKRPMISRSLLIVATPYVTPYTCSTFTTEVFRMADCPRLGSPLDICIYMSHTCHAIEMCDKSYERMRHVTELSCISTRHVTQWMRHVTQWMRHVTQWMRHVTQSGQASIWMRHVIHMNEACHTVVVHIHEACHAM